MKEIKYINSFSRNIWLYLVGYTVLYLIYKININLQIFILGLIAYVTSYSVVYFLNDYTDREDDNRYKRANLSLAIRNKALYWLTVFILMSIGLTLSFSISKTSFILLNFI